MSTPRIAFAAVLVVAAWTTVISGLVAVGAAKAEAAWLKPGPGTGYAAGLKLQTPGQPVVESARCNNGSGGPSATLHWSYPTPLPPGFELFTATTSGGPVTTAGTATTTSATIPLPSNNKVYVSVRATAGTWKGTRSPEAQAC
ncbi:hypothetical protein AMES_4400 [Amycolatopsis mediterranei S699]|uniref:Ig-like domain-containing protein n=1 Tax=Amycolatopsis mediterranei (strain U-32) TaxID=749927 RepID=A0A0H3D5D2_AMYMU|nr:hypothetical protein [Amycolatopsis mediterranei]ADJ46225.1 hypothetical protein AMED_4454 [Amycolatopsis mediterranei U32]AFO77936.1 hypothetical protein AMES_4400 [Amycolatopsis mediterranei S699]AGT85064.1 hypothetical protein B737_4400 [Amycolatopsis mediterranei RB]KDO05265.1 hypothetical protein DV26_39690 [Amycolatopsis mediterranei]KDU87850.1 hypothetical protein DV36_33635 [Amycolatopsis mediterranei]